MRAAWRAPRWWGIAAALVLVCPTPGAGQSAPGASPATPQPDELLRRMATYLAAQEAFTFHAEINFDAADPTGQKLQFAGELSVAVKRPDRLQMDYIDDLSAKSVWYDGERFTLLDRDHDVYASEPVGPDIDAALARLDESFKVSLPLADLVLSDPYTELKRGVKSERWVGRHDVNGVGCDHLAFVDENIDWQIWIEPGERPLPRKLVVTYKTVAGAPQYVAVLTEWDTRAKLKASRFVARIPPAAVATRFLAVEEVP